MAWTKLLYWLNIQELGVKIANTQLFEAGSAQKIHDLTNWEIGSRGLKLIFFLQEFQMSKKWKNGENAYLTSVFFCVFFHRPEEYKKKVAEYVRKYASEEALRNLRDPTEVSSSSESSMSDYSEDEAQV